MPTICSSKISEIKRCPVCLNSELDKEVVPLLMDYHLR